MLYFSYCSDKYTEIKICDLEPFSNFEACKFHEYHKFIIYDFSFEDHHHKIISWISQVFFTMCLDMILALPYRLCVGAYRLEVISTANRRLVAMVTHG